MYRRSFLTQLAQAAFFMPLMGCYGPPHYPPQPQNPGTGPGTNHPGTGNPALVMQTYPITDIVYNSNTRDIALYGEMTNPETGLQDYLYSQFERVSQVRQNGPADMKLVVDFSQGDGVSASDRDFDGSQKDAYVIQMPVLVSAMPKDAQRCFYRNGQDVYGGLQSDDKGLPTYMNVHCIRDDNRISYWSKRDEQRYIRSLYSSMMNVFTTASAPYKRTYMEVGEVNAMAPTEPGGATKHFKPYKTVSYC